MQRFERSIRVVVSPIRGLLGAVVIATIAAQPASAVIFDEADLGDLSSDGNSPTMLPFELGENVVRGTMGRPPGGQVDSDIFAFTVPDGQLLTSLRIDFMDPLENSFFAIAHGSTIRTNVTHPTDGGASHASNMLVSQTGEHLHALAAFKQYGGSSTLESPAGPGAYTIWFQETSARVDYQMTLQLVPEPATLGVVVFGVALLSLNRLGKRFRFLPA